MQQLLPALRRSRRHQGQQAGSQGAAFPILGGEKLAYGRELAGNRGNIDCRNEIAYQRDGYENEAECFGTGSETLDYFLFFIHIDSPPIT